MTQQRDSVQSTLDQISAIGSSKNTPIKIIAASKQQSPHAIRELAQSGIVAFGENYLQEALPKIEELKDLNLEWHFIGRIQSNKTKLIAQHFDWVQTIDSLRTAQRLNQARLDAGFSKPLNCCIQVNIEQEPQKSGMHPGDIPALLPVLLQLEALRVRGLMAIPKPQPTSDLRRGTFNRIERLFDDLGKAEIDQWDTLSMGMSADYIDAIECGSTMIRLGTVLFGPRKNQA